MQGGRVGERWRQGLVEQPGPVTVLWGVGCGVWGGTLSPPLLPGLLRKGEREQADGEAVLGCKGGTSWVPEARGGVRWPSVDAEGWGFMAQEAGLVCAKTTDVPHLPWVHYSREEL